MGTNSLEYERAWRDKNRDKSAARSNRYRIAHAEEIKAKRKLRSRLKEKARAKVRDFAARGKIIKPSHCQQCSKKAVLHAHHFDYSKPLEVIWVCYICHGKYHMKYPLALAKEKTQ